MLIKNPPFAPREFPWLIWYREEGYQKSEGLNKKFLHEIERFLVFDHAPQGPVQYYLKLNKFSLIVNYQIFDLVFFSLVWLGPNFMPFILV